MARYESSTPYIKGDVSLTSSCHACPFPRFIHHHIHDTAIKTGCVCAAARPFHTSHPPLSVTGGEVVVDCDHMHMAGPAQACS